MCDCLQRKKIIVECCHHFLKLFDKTMMSLFSNFALLEELSGDGDIGGEAGAGIIVPNKLQL